MIGEILTIICYIFIASSSLYNAITTFIKRKWFLFSYNVIATIFLVFVLLVFTVRCM